MFDIFGQVFVDAVEWAVAVGNLGAARRLLPRLAALARHNQMEATCHKACLTLGVLEMQAGDLVLAQESFTASLADSAYLRR